MKRNEYSRSETHFTFFMVGLSCMLIYSIVDLESFILLRYLGYTSYDAQTITFFIRRFNLMIGIISTGVSIFFGVSVVCANWHWLLFILYFLATLYIYLLSNSYISINKLALIPIFIISLVSHGMFISTIKYIFEGSYNKYDRDTGLCLLILLCGSYSSGLLVKFLIRISGDLKHVDGDNYPGLELFTRLFVLFTLITLMTSFLLSRLPCEPEDENSNNKSANKTLKNVINSRSCYVFYMGCVAFSFSPMLNNITLSIINQLSMLEAFSLEYIQFVICLSITLTIYLLILTNVIYIYSKGGRTETLYDIICRILKISNEANPDIVVDDNIVEDLVTNQSLGIRLFRTPQPWCYLQYGFWTRWENYDCVDHVRIFNLVGMKMLIAKIRGGEDFDNYPDDCVIHKTLQDQYLDILDAKYALIWLLCCFIKQCNDVICTIPYILHRCDAAVNCNCAGGGSCGNCCTYEIKHTKCVCVLMCLKNCCKSSTGCSSCCFSKCFDKLFDEGMCKSVSMYVDNNKCLACCRSFYPAYQNFVYGILATCASEARTLIKNISESPDLVDNLKIDKSIELSLTVLEEFIQKFFGLMVYARVADEILLLFEQMPKIAFNITKSLICFMCKCKCTGTSNGCKCCLELENGQFKCKCVCVLYAKFIRCVCLLHKKQNDVCKIILGYSKESLSSVLPTLSMTRAVSLFSSYFGDYMDAPSMIEPATCKCSGGCGSTSNGCSCCKWSTRVNDLLEMMFSGLEFLSEYDGVLSLITFFLSYFKQWKLDDIPSTSSSAQCTCCCTNGQSSCCSCAGSSSCKCCICCLCCCGGKGNCSCSISDSTCNKCFICLCCDKCCTSISSGTCSTRCCTNGQSSCCSFTISACKCNGSSVCGCDGTSNCCKSCCVNGTSICSQDLKCECFICSDKCCSEKKCCCTDGNKECCFDCSFCCYIKREVKVVKERNVAKAVFVACNFICICKCKCYEDRITKLKCKPILSEVVESKVKTLFEKLLECKPTVCMVRHRLQSAWCEAKAVLRIAIEDEIPLKKFIVETARSKAEAVLIGDGLLKLSENSKKNLELITSTRRTMVLQSVSDYVAKNNAFRDIVKNLNSSYVGLRIFNLYLFLCALIYLFCIVGNAIPYLRNTTVNPRLTFLITFFSCITSVSIIYSFLYLSDFGRDSSLLVNLVIFIGMILCILWSWATQWLSYRMLLFNQFEQFYSKFRVIYTGNVNVYKPNVRWWFEGLLSFIKTDFGILYLILTMKDLSQFYDPFSFGFTSRLKVKYNNLNVNVYNVDQKGTFNQHIITNQEFTNNMESLLYDLGNYGTKYDLSLLLDYRSFQQIPPDSYRFMTDLYPYEKLGYSIDMLFASWKLGVLMTRSADRLQYMREHALKFVETQIQDEIKMNNYEHKLLFKLKYYFDFRTSVLFDLADNCVDDSIHFGAKLSSIQSHVLVGLYQSEYIRRFSKYLKQVELDNQESEFSKLQHDVDELGEGTSTDTHEPSSVNVPQPSTSTGIPSSVTVSNVSHEHFEQVKDNVESTKSTNSGGYQPPTRDLLLKKCREWRRQRLQVCDTVYRGNLVCKAVVTKTADELELVVFDKHNKDPLDTFITLIQAKGHDIKDTSDLKIAKFLSAVSKSGNLSELDKLKSEISELILRDTSMNKFFGSVLKGYLSVSKNIYYEHTMATYFDRNEEVVIGEWIRWQGQHISSNILSLLSKFVSIDTSK